MNTRLLDWNKTLFVSNLSSGQLWCSLLFLQILQKTKDLVEKMGLDVIYGDTDSVFVWERNAGDSRQARAAGTAPFTPRSRSPRPR